MNTHTFTTCRTTAVRRLLAIALCVCAGAAGAQSYSLNWLPSSGEVSGGRFDSGNGINSAGMVVGTVGVTHQYWGHLWSSPTAPPVVLSSSLCCTYTFTSASDINNAGWVVGQDTYRAALWTNGTATLLPTLGSDESSARGINDAGQVVGHTGNPAGSTRATLWSGGQAMDLGTLGGISSSADDINSTGMIVGSSQQAGDGNLHATLWHNGTITALGAPANSPSEATAINDAGQVVGYSDNRAALWNQGALTYLSSFSSRAHGINNVGQVVGLTEIAPDEYHATLWNGGAAIDLNSFLSQSDRDAGWYLETANAINDAGWITGSAFNSRESSRAAFLLTGVPAVPEASTLALWLAGLCVLWMASRRTRIRSTAWSHGLRTKHPSFA
jgi:probable HAF family extracellular repeat protein